MAARVRVFAMAFYAREGVRGSGGATRYRWGRRSTPRPGATLVPEELNGQGVGRESPVVVSPGWYNLCFLAFSVFIIADTR